MTTTRLQPNVQSVAHFKHGETSVIWMGRAPVEYVPADRLLDKDRAVHQVRLDCWSGAIRSTRCVGVSRINDVNAQH